MTSHEATVELAERLQAMMRQECTSYLCPDYLSSEWQQSLQGVLNPQSASSSSSSVMNEMWREKICEWSYQVVDHFDFNRELVSVSMSYLDRYLATRTVSKKIFQLAAMTSLYLAIKLYEPGQLRMSSLIDLSRGYFMVEHIASMEDSMLQALGWYVHPPTPFRFVQDLAALLPGDISPELRHDLCELARFLTELSVCDYFFVTKKPSSVAVAAMLYAIERQGGVEILYPDTKERFMQRLVEVGMYVANDLEVYVCYEHLKEMYIAGGYSPANESEENSSRIATVSPVSVLTPISDADSLEAYGECESSPRTNQ